VVTDGPTDQERIADFRSIQGRRKNMLRVAVTAQTIVFTLRNRAHRLRDERGAEAVQVALITAALVVLALLLIAAIRNRAEPAIDEINGLMTR
jgi:Flp pilus assembly pilin Flp